MTNAGAQNRWEGRTYEEVVDELFNYVAVKDVLMKRGHNPEDANTLIRTHMSVYLRYHDDRTAEQVADLIENAEKERKKSIIKKAVKVIEWVNDRERMEETIINNAVGIISSLIIVYILLYILHLLLV